MPSSNHPAATAAPLPTDIPTPPATSRRHWLKSLGGASVAGVLGSQLVACGGGSGSSGGFLPFASAAPPPASPSETPTLPAKALFPAWPTACTSTARPTTPGTSTPPTR